MDNRRSILMLLAMACISTLPQWTVGGMPPHDGYNYDGMEMNMCPMMDCSYLEYMLESECSREDRYVPRVMMYGVMCDTCPQCRDFPYYRSLLSSTIAQMQEMFERTLVMQNFLDDNENILANIEELTITPEVVDAFQGLLQRNLETLQEYSMYNALGVIDNLQTTADKLAQLLEGSDVNSMSDILNDYTSIRMTMLPQDSVNTNTPQSLSQLINALQELLKELSRRHIMIKKVIEEETPILRAMLNLPEDEFEALWNDDRLTVRVAFKLLEKSQEAIQSLLEMNMDKTGSSLQTINQEAETALVGIWETLSNDVIDKDSVNDASQTSGFEEQVDGSGEVQDEKTDTVIAIESNTLTRNNNLLFQWLSSRYMQHSVNK